MWLAKYLLNSATFQRHVTVDQHKSTIKHSMNRSNKIAQLNNTIIWVVFTNKFIGKLESSVGRHRDQN